MFVIMVANKLKEPVTPLALRLPTPTNKETCRQQAKPIYQPDLPREFE